MDRRTEFEMRWHLRRMTGGAALFVVFSFLYVVMPPEKLLLVVLSWMVFKVGWHLSAYGRLHRNVPPCSECGHSFFEHDPCLLVGTVTPAAPCRGFSCRGENPLGLECHCQAYVDESED